MSHWLASACTWLERKREHFHFLLGLYSTARRYKR